jgi:agmatine deiminase
MGSAYGANRPRLLGGATISSALLLNTATAVQSLLMVGFTRKQFIVAMVASPLVFPVLAGCGDSSGNDAAPPATLGGATDGTDPTDAAPNSIAVTTRELDGTWRMPAEETPHERTWMCWPSSTEVWGSDLAGVQTAIVAIATAISRFEPVALLVRPEERERVGKKLPKVMLVEAPVDDLWARDTLPSFLTRQSGTGAVELAAGRVQFNGWGGKQIHSGDADLTRIVAEHLRVPLIDSGVVGEGGGLEIDGQRTVLAAASSWVNDNRNPGRSRDQIAAALLNLLGAERMIWIDGLAGADITDGHIDTLGRFATPTTIVIDKPAFDDRTDPWVAVAARTKDLLGAARTSANKPYKIVSMTQPTKTRQTGDSFLSTYMNYYVCNGAVIAPEFGDRSADTEAKRVLTALFPGRQIVQLNIDALAAGGGGIHCATQQQPSTRT